MPKFTVYIPDDLWAQATAALDIKNPSQATQAALREQIDRARSEDLPPELIALRTSVIDKVGQVARERYEDGYDLGLRLATGLSWRDLRILATRHPSHWDLDLTSVRNTADLKSSFGESDEASLSLRQLFETYRDAVEDVPLEELDSDPWPVDMEGWLTSGQPPVEIRGLQQALIDTHNAVAQRYGVELLRTPIYEETEGFGWVSRQPGSPK